MKLADELESTLGKTLKTSEGVNSEVYVEITEAEFPSTIDALSRNDFELVSLFCAENFLQEGFVLLYAFEKRGYCEVLVIRCPLNNNQAISIAKVFPSACWYEREVTDGFGVQFQGAFDTRRLFLHETYPENFHPLLKSVKNGEVPNRTLEFKDEYVFKEVEGEGVYQIPVGPVHAGIIEPGHFRFSVIGETIFNLEVRLFYIHRGLEKFAEGKNPLEVVKVAEAVSGDETAANAFGFCNAVEKICDVNVPKRGQKLRTVLLEMERIYSYLGDLAGMIVDVAYPVGASPFFVLREEIFRLNAELTGSRFLKGVFAIGGLTKDVPEQALRNLAVYLQSFPERLKIAKALDSTFFSLVDRFESTGKVKPEILSPLHITGPVARSSGKMTDTRVNHPYGLYGDLGVDGRTLQNGDVLARFELKFAETLDSVGLIQRVFGSLEGGAVSAPCTVQDGYALSLVESARGQNVHWVYIKKGLVDRYKVRTASFCNWQSMEHAVLGNIVPDFPLINKSMNLSYAGTDL
jgi:formate hydrogenlyase subunit 5